MKLKLSAIDLYICYYKNADYLLIFFFFFMNGNTEQAQCALSRVHPLRKGKGRQWKRIKQIYKISKKGKKKKKKYPLESLMM